jgi:hypothetical protein
VSETNVERQNLQELVQQRMELQWPGFAQTHPHLAAAIERTVLVNNTVSRLADDPEFRQAMAAGAGDQVILSATADLVKLIDQSIRHVLGL